MANTIKIFLFSLLSLLITLAVLETGLRVCAPQDCIQPMMAQMDPEIIYTLTPNHSACLKGTSTRMYRLTTNRLGLRDRDIPTNKPPNTFRIMLLGDSLSMGEGVQLEETYIEQLETMLKGQSPLPIETINAAIRGYGTDQELILFQRLGRKFHPDLVILAFYLGNDIDDNWEGGLFKLEKGVLTQQTPNARTSLKFKYFSIQSRLQNTLGYSFLMAHSHLANWLRLRYARLVYHSVFKGTKKAFENTPQDNQPRFQLTMAILDEWNTAVRQAGAQPFMLIVPRRQELELLRASQPGNQLKLDREVEKYCRNARIPFLNLTDVLRQLPGDLESLYLEHGSGYFNPRGHAVIAQALVNVLRANALLPSSTR